MNKCPPGVICVESVSVIVIFGILLVLLYLHAMNTATGTCAGHQHDTHQPHRQHRQPIVGENWYHSLIPSWPYTNAPLTISTGSSVLTDPHAPPLRDERYFNHDAHPAMVGPGHGFGHGHGVPINVSTNIGAVDAHYRQVGILTPLNGSTKDSILSLMGRPLFTNRNKWQYYTISNQHNNVKLPISVKGRSASGEHGVDIIYNGDTLYIEGINDAYKTTIYDNDTIKYLPFI